MNPTERIPRKTLLSFVPFVRFVSFVPFVSFVLLACVAATRNNVVEPQRFGRGVTSTGGTALMYIGTYNGSIQIFDEATEKLVDEIKLQTGIPRSLTLSFDRKRFYVLDSTLEKV